MTGNEFITEYNKGRRDFKGANLSCAVLRDAEISDANLSGAILSNADLSGAVLSDANLSCSDLRGASLRGSNLRDADLSGADLRCVDLSCAVLRDAYLRGSDLSDASLNGVNLSGADLRGAIYKNIKIKELRVFSGLYKYLVMSIIAEDDSEWIRMGCHFRKRVDWDENFWNNECEFPNNGSYNSELRLYAFKCACDWIDLKKKTISRRK